MKLKKPNVTPVTDDAIIFLVAGFTSGGTPLQRCLLTGHLHI